MSVGSEIERSHLRLMLCLLTLLFAVAVVGWQYQRARRMIREFRGELEQVEASK